VFELTFSTTGIAVCPVEDTTCSSIPASTLPVQVVPTPVTVLEPLVTVTVPVV
jgi:hypothetical protein